MQLYYERAMGKKLTNCKQKKTQPLQSLSKAWTEEGLGGVGRRKHAPLREAPARAPPYAELSPNPRPG